AWSKPQANSYESGAGVEYDDLPLTSRCTCSGHAYSTKHDREDIRLDHLSRLWVTYRRDFSPIGGSEGPKTDKGWGCMLRCGQMMLAEAIVRVKLGPSLALVWRNLHGRADGKPVGQWFGPNTVAQAIRKLSAFDQFANLLVHVALDNTVIIDDLKALLRSSADSKALLAICAPPPGPVRPQPAYVPALKRCLEMPKAWASLARKPNHAHYFIGYQGNELYYLDPHTTQDWRRYRPAVSGVAAAATASGSLSLSEPSPDGRSPSVDPSLAVGFDLRNEAQLDDLCASLVAPDGAAVRFAAVRSPPDPAEPLAG
uniref:Cysteine protease n=1 Tax=Macrostomum lignano TaxID=282301 RepID=A0A1I8IN24_9PLAT